MLNTLTAHAYRHTTGLNRAENSVMAYAPIVRNEQMRQVQRVMVPATPIHI